MKKGLFSRLLCAALVFMTVTNGGIVFKVQQSSAAGEKIEWRPLINRKQAEFGADKVDYPQYYTKGKYGGEGYQYIHGAAIHPDGTVLMGQDMGSARVSTDFGKTWYSPPNIGNPLYGGNACAIDPADSNVMFIAMSSNNLKQAVPQLLNLEGIYRSDNKGQSWTLVQAIPDITYTSGYRFYKDTFACYPISGGSSDERIWRFATSDQDGGPGSFWESKNGGRTWTKVTNLANGTYGPKYDLDQHPTQVNTLYMCTKTGLWRTTDGGKNWTELFASKIQGSPRSLWIDPDDPNHMIVSVTSNTTSQRGIWETTNGGTSWNNIMNAINPGQAAVGAKNAQGKRMIYVHNDDSTGSPRIRNFSGNWITPTIQAANPEVWNQQSITGSMQCVFLPHPTEPDVCLVHGRNYWWRSEGTEGRTWVPSNTNYFGFSINGVHFDDENWRIMDMATQDSGTTCSTTGGDWFTLSNITGKGTGQQWDRMIKQVGADKVKARSGRDIVRLSDPWPSNVPPPANSKVPGRRILSLGGSAAHFIFTQDKGQTTWNDWIGKATNVGGNGVNRDHVFFSRQNPNVVYTGPNVSTDGGTTWTINNGSRRVAAMSYINGDTIYSVNEAKPNYHIMRSTNQGSSWSTIFTTTWRILDNGSNGKIFTGPNSDKRLYTVSEEGDVYLLKESGGTWSGKNLNLSGSYGSKNPGWVVEFIRVDYSDPRLIYALVDVAGAPTVWRGRLNESFTACTWEDISANAPRISMSSKIFVHPVTGDLLLGSGCGNFVYPAPDDWEHKDPAKRQYKRALWLNLPKPIPNDGSILEEEEKEPLPSNITGIITEVGPYKEENIASNMIDGDFNTYYNTNVLGAYIQYDLGSVKDVNYIALSWYGSASDRKYKFKLQGSKDGNNFTDITGNLLSAGLAKGNYEFFKFRTQNIRYIRYICKGNTSTGVSSFKFTDICEVSIGFMPLELSVESVRFTLKDAVGGDRDITQTGLQSGNIKTDITVKNTNETFPTPVRVGVAVYYKGKLVGIKVTDKEDIPSEGQLELSLTTNVTVSQGQSVADYRVKVFVWDSLSEIQPAAEVITFSSSGVTGL